MLFQSWVFLVFFLVVYLVYLPLRHTRHWVVWLLVASYFFYGWCNWAYPALLLCTTAVNFFCVRRMARGARKALWLTLSLLVSLGLLGFFKYSIFAIENVNHLMAALGSAHKLPLPQDLLPPGWTFILPVGISFFTFASLTYTVDYYRGQIEEEPSFLRYAAFVSFFPQILAGPIERARNMLSQFATKREITREHIADGLSLFLVGFFKKVAIADYLASYVNQVYAVPQMYNSPALFLATFAFAWQIYCDFSGYTDMARGVARLLGFNVMLNFNNPYLATGLGEFWQRWHISLSSWFKDYVYIPLGGNRHGAIRTYVNMFLTMLVAGVWHGASWTFVIWGGLHACGRTLTRELERTRFYSQRVPKFAKQMLVFAIVLLTWVFCRASTFQDAITVVRRIFTTPLTDPQFPVMGYVLCLGLWAYQFTYESRFRRVLESGPMRVATAVGMILYLLFFASSKSQGFIYFQF